MKLISYRKGYKYQLAEDYTVQTKLRPVQAIETRYILLSVDGLLTIENGYAWDGASGPSFDTRDSMRGSLGHDAKYQLIRMRLLDYSAKVIADQELYDDLVEDKMWRWRAAYWLKSVETFGYISLAPESVSEVLTAP
jgi:hypothetical protein